jgi:beta-barrel assembly-enhancing protease
MVHVQKRHVARSMIQALGVFTILSVFLGDITGVVGVVLDQGGPLLNLSYSRELEEEADEQALYLLTQSKINPIGLSNSLEKINNETQKLISEQPAAEIIEKLQKIEILNSHPEVEKRILQLREKASDLTKIHHTEKIVYDYQKFKNEVQKHF